MARPLAVGFSVVVLSCASGPSGPPETVRLENGEESDAEVYMPLVDGTVFSYETIATPKNERGMFTIQVRRTGGNRVTLQLGGKTEFVRTGRDGIAFETGGYLLKAPVYKGSSFQGASGTVVVKDAGVSVNVPEGRFANCVRTVEGGGEQVREVVTVYCPHVGIVSLDTEDFRGVRQAARLKSHGPRVDVLSESREHAGAE